MATGWSQHASLVRFLIPHGSAEKRETVGRSLAEMDIRKQNPSRQARDSLSSADNLPLAVVVCGMHGARPLFPGFALCRQDLAASHAEAERLRAKQEELLALTPRTLCLVMGPAVVASCHRAARRIASFRRTFSPSQLSS